jgi:RNA polymerase sigma-70 factor (ECF subfamily)
MGRPSAAELFERHHLAMFRFLRRLSGRAEIAEDLTQEVFLRVVRRLDSYQERQQERAWLFRIARNVFFDRGRQAARAPGAAVVQDANVASVVAPQVTALALDQALACLAETERTAFLMREVGGLGYAEIAEVLETTPDAVRNRIHRARLALREALAALPSETRPRAAQEGKP